MYNLGRVDMSFIERCSLFRVSFIGGSTVLFLCTVLCTDEQDLTSMISLPSASLHTLQFLHRLEPGDMFTLNNHRMLHGRKKIRLNGGSRYLNV